MNEYEERQKEKAERYTELADKARAKSETAYKTSDTLAGMIPFGQPILIGHHSEGRHRRDIERIHSAMDRSIKERHKAEYYQNKAENALNPSCISSDNPDAINLLKDKLVELEANQKKMKAINAAHKAYLKNPESLESANFSNEIKEKIRTYTPRYSWEPHPIPPYALTNNNGNIKRIEERIKDLEANQAMPYIDKEINGVRMVTDKEANRLRLFFPGIPAQEVRDKLKRNGFIWCPTAGAWQRQISNGAVYYAEDILNGLNSSSSPTQTTEDNNKEVIE